jgi:phosphoribosylaminoimidazolecarboxamide formyltransferase/IMP cyclohydrolase
VVKRALVSVSDKTGLTEFVGKLAAAGVEIVSTGGTKKVLEAAGIPVRSVSDVTGFPEILDGRVKTLHPAIHGGLLAVRNNPSHMAQLEKYNIQPIDFVIVNLYPFKETIARPDCTYAQAVENIDIGGPSMLRAAAKNHGSVTVVCDPADYERVAGSLDANANVPLALRRELAAKVFRHTAAYDAIIADYFTKQTGDEFPEKLTITFDKKQGLRYGENPHQKAAFYRDPIENVSTISAARQLHGKALSYNNIRDADAALGIVKEFAEPAAVAVKHMNPCGIGTADSIDEAYNRAYAVDTMSIFGGIVALNREVGSELAKKLHSIFLEIVIAPSFTDEALSILEKKKNLRLLQVDLTDNRKDFRQYTSIRGGMLVQELDTKGYDDIKDQLKVVTERQPTAEEMASLKFAWTIVKHVKSNAIALVNHGRMVGMGGGQPNRVGAAKIALEEAGEKTKGAVLASDAFFPMGDTVEAAAQAGITAVIQPGGSIRDQQSIDMANKYNVAMVFTGMRHFKH